MSTRSQKNPSVSWLGLSEWPTWVVLVGCYTLWSLTTLYHAEIGVLWFVPAMLLVTLHSSLQHEALHGHPTRSALLNELLVAMPLGVFFPYRRFRTLHLKHHDNEQLTDPYDDPESWYRAEDDHARAPFVLRLALEASATLMGRLVVGPILAIIGFTLAEIRIIKSGDRAVLADWIIHIASLVPVVVWLVYCGLNPLVYVLLAALPGHALLLIRTYIEHRAADDPAHRSVIVEAEWLFAFLFLNNCYHALHHERPRIPWFRLPRTFTNERARILADNGAYHFKGYWPVFRRYFLRRREPVVHPFMRRR